MLIWVLKEKKNLNIEALKQKHTETENFLQNIVPI